jgi:hypothetical protein
MRLADRFRRLALRLAGREPSIEDERLVALFRNRLELKKELGELAEERHRLLDRLKLQEGATMRVEEQLATLEQYLGRADEGDKNLAYFQLKALWRTASRRLEQFGLELARQQKDRERQAQLAAFERQKRDRASVLRRDVDSARVAGEQLLAEQKFARQRLGQLRGFWHYFRRRDLEASLVARQAEIDAGAVELARLQEELQRVEAEPPPLFEGMSVDGRRAVNLAVIAYAELLCERLAAGQLAELARQSTLQRVYESSYGPQAECRALLQRAAQAVAELERMQDDYAAIKARADQLRRRATYRAATDTVPQSESIAGAGSRSPNVLLEEYWDVYSALVR